MSTSFSSSLDQVFGAPGNHEAYNLLKALYKAHPKSQHVPVLDGADGSFPIWDYLNSIDIQHNTCECGSNPLDSDEPGGELTLDTFLVFPYSSKSEQVTPRPFHGKFTFQYDGVDFIAYKASWPRAYFFDLVFTGGDDSVGRRLASAVYKFASTLKDEIWMYQFGHWSRDKELYDAVQQAKWDDLVLDETFKENLRRDVHLFFQSKGIYEALEITWKRGVLLLGPPGNGKTDSIRALIKDSKYPALYVKSFTTQIGPEAGVRSIFTHARKCAPCILIIEDLDAMVTPAIRSFFLNELDGLAANHGILTIATTNHPERIDDSIVNRPSRFDVKYSYDLPTKALRKAFADKWVAKINNFKHVDAQAPVVVFSTSHDEISEKVAEDTDGFSFAFLKELFVSFLLAFAHAESGGKRSAAPEILLFKQIEVLSAQMIKTEGDSGNEGEGEAPLDPFAARHARRAMVAQPAESMFFLQSLGV